jgi:hypothetical protein
VEEEEDSGATVLPKVADGAVLMVLENLIVFVDEVK